MFEIPVPQNYKIQKLFEHYTQNRAIAFVYSLFKRLEQGDAIPPIDVGRLCLEILADSRPLVSVALAERMPLPMGDVKEFLKGKELDMAPDLATELPGLFAQLEQLPTRKKHSKEMEAQLSECFVPREQYRMALEALKYFPFWEALLCSPDIAVRRAAVCRIPVSGCLFSALLSHYVDDPDDEVRRAVASMLGIRLPRSSAGTWSKPIVEFDQLKLIIAKIPIDSDEIEPYLTDHRPNVRYIAATRLSSQSPHWMKLARDTSARVRGQVAHRAALDHPAVEIITFDLKCRNILAKRRAEIFNKKLKEGTLYEGRNEQKREDHDNSRVPINSH